MERYNLRNPAIKRILQVLLATTILPSCAALADYRLKPSCLQEMKEMQRSTSEDFAAGALEVLPLSFAKPSPLPVSSDMLTSLCCRKTYSIGTLLSGVLHAQSLR